MKAAQNPFNPGSGLRPPALVGRDAEIEALDVVVERVSNGLGSRGIMLSGLRGVGKTVLLNELRGRAENAGWLTVSLEARPDDAGAASVRRILAREITAQARSLSVGRAVSARVKAALGAVASFNVKFGTTGIDLGVEVARGRADSGDIEVDLPELVQDLSAALGERGGAFGLFIDELQDLDAELLRALLVAQHQAGQRGWPFYIVGAGLPHLPGVLAEARSYAERLFDYRSITRLTDGAAAAALHDPVARLGVSFDDVAIARLVKVSGGYPYFLQEYGRAAWETSAGPVITAEDAETSIVIGLERLDAGFFHSRWNRATRSERRLLIAMAEDNNTRSSSSEVARRMGIKPTSLGPYRANLISKGLVYAPDHGFLAYTVPNMAEYVHRHRENLD
jgi:hypothetical protein